MEWRRSANQKTYGNTITTVAIFNLPDGAIESVQDGFNITIKDHFSGCTVVHIPASSKDGADNSYDFEELKKYVIGADNCAAFHSLDRKIYPDQACFLGPDGVALQMSEQYFEFGFCWMIKMRLDGMRH